MICKVAATLRRHKTNHCKCVATVSAFVTVGSSAGPDKSKSPRSEKSLTVATSFRAS